MEFGLLAFDFLAVFTGLFVLLLQVSLIVLVVVILSY